MARLLRFGAVRKQGGPHHVHRDPIRELRQLSSADLGDVDRELGERAAAPAVLDRPVRCDPTPGVQRLLPFQFAFEARKTWGSRVLVEERAELLAKLQFRRRQGQVHGALPSGSHASFCERGLQWLS